MYINKRQ
ncbi:ef72bdf3-d67b-4173-8871-3d3b8b19fc63 [Thermothielavioides terrestris]|nr:ef72bdf3-d67b-4173-8871-3d3b8b19fc63 [Thermothielavioides terrestris]